MIRVAIVEDDRTIRESLEAIVAAEADFEFVGAWMTAEEALEALPQQKPDVVLMDIQLPNMSGIDCVAHLKELMPGVQVIMVTVYGDPDRIFRALRAGASGYLLKRSKPEQVARAIRDVLDGQAPMSSDITRKVLSFFREKESAMSDVEKLSPREREILDLVVYGLSVKVISDRLGISVSSLRWHMRHIYTKLQVHSRTEIMVKYRAK